MKTVNPKEMSFSWWNLNWIRFFREITSSLKSHDNGCAYGSFSVAQIELKVGKLCEWKVRLCLPHSMSFNHHSHVSLCHWQPTHSVEQPWNDNAFQLSVSSLMCGREASAKWNCWGDKAKEKTWGGEAAAKSFRNWVNIITFLYACSSLGVNPFGGIIIIRLMTSIRDSSVVSTTLPCIDFPSQFSCVLPNAALMLTQRQFVFIELPTMKSVKKCRRNHENIFSLAKIGKNYHSEWKAWENWKHWHMEIKTHTQEEGNVNIFQANSFVKFTHNFQWKLLN